MTSRNFERLRARTCAPTPRRAAAPGPGRAASPIRRREPPPNAAARGLGDGVEDVHAGHNQQPNRPALTLGQRDNGRQQPPLVVGRPRIEPTDRPGRRADDAHGHHHHVAIARRCSAAARCVRTCGLPDRHQQVARPCFHLLKIDFVRGQQLEFVERRCQLAGLRRMADADQQRRRQRQTRMLPASVPASGAASTATDGTTTSTPTATVRSARRGRRW